MFQKMNMLLDALYGGTLHSKVPYRGPSNGQKGATTYTTGVLLTILP